jgi:tetratricopeptide (TPR) repeat protein
MTNLAGAYQVSGQAERGIPLMERVVEIRKSRLGASHPETLLAMANLSVNYCALERYAEAEPILVQWLDEQRKRLPPDALEIALREKRLGHCRLMLRKYADAEKSLRDALAVFEMRQAGGENHHETESMLGAALMGQKKHDEAEALLVRSATALKANAGSASSASRKLSIAAMQRVIDLYESCKRDDDAARWRKELKDLESEE